MRLLACVAPLLLAATSLATQESDVGVTDWYKQLLGVPAFERPSTAPSFLRTSGQELILTATKNNVLGALHPDNGTIVVATLSSAGGAYLRTFEPLTGQLLLEKRLHAPEQGLSSTPFDQGTDVSFSHDASHLYTLTNGHTVRKLNSTSGDIEWTWASPDQTSLVLYSRVVYTLNAVYVVGVAASVASYTLHVTALDLATGVSLIDKHIDSKVVDPLKEFAILHQSTHEPVMLWIQDEGLRSLRLVPDLERNVKVIKASGCKSIVAADVARGGQAVITSPTGTSFILKLDQSDEGKTVWEFSDPTSAGGTPPSHHGAFDELGRAYISQLYWSHPQQKLRADVFSTHLERANTLDVPYDVPNDGVPDHIAMSSSNPSEDSIDTRFFITTSTGNIQLWHGETLKWTRDESLASISVAEFVELPEAQGEASAVLSSEGFMERLQRHLVDAQSFPSYAFNFAKRFATGSYASPTTLASPASSNTTLPLSRDAFGFRQVLVVATSTGRLCGLDSSTGETIWCRTLGLGWAAAVGAKVRPAKLFIVKSVSDGVQPEVVLVGYRQADNGLVDTVLYHVNAITGADIFGQNSTRGPLQGFDVIEGPFVNAYFMNVEDSKFIVLADEFLQIYLYPNTEQINQLFRKVAPTVSVPLRVSAGDGIRIQGHEITLSDNPKHKPTAGPTWALNFPEGEDVTSFVPPSTQGPIASVGKVLGDRTTLYKYLNPRLFVALTTSREKPVCGLYVIDGAKGTIVYHTEVKMSGSGCNIHPVLVENWLVYHYYEDEVASGTVGGAKGWRIVSVEFYEGQGVDQKIKSSELSSSSNDTLNYSTYEQAWVFPYGITAIAPTQTKFGISTKDIIIATTNHRVQSYPRRFLDPRRPNRKVTAQEQEEFLIQNDPQMYDDPKRVLSHNYQVAKVAKIVTAPALLESTSLVFAYGLDLFLTRVAPSNTFDVLSKSFNKAQLVITVSGLLFAIAITKPMVERKKLRERWYHS